MRDDRRDSARLIPCHGPVAGFWRGPARIALMLAMALTLCAGLAQGAAADVFRLTEATLYGLGPARQVSLPNRLLPTDFTPTGGMVEYRLELDLKQVPDHQLALFLSKLSLSGRLLINGAPVWSCGADDLAELRCLHQANFITVPNALWHVGKNILSFQIYATNRQMNGMTAPVIGDDYTIYHSYYLPTRLIKTDLLRILATLSGMFGFLCVLIGLRLRDQPILPVFGLAALSDALAALNWLVVDPLLSSGVFSWFVYSARMISIPLILMTMLAGFDRLSRRDGLSWALGLYTILAPAAVAISGSSRGVVLIAYALILPGICWVAAICLRGAFRKPTPFRLGLTLVMAILLLSALIDYGRLAGVAPFDGVYLIGYVFALMTFIVGSTLIGKIAHSLVISRNFAQTLEQRVSERTSELQSALTTIRNMGDNALRLTRNIPVGTFILRIQPDGQPTLEFFSDRLRQIFDLPLHGDVPPLDRIRKAIHRDDLPSWDAALHAASHGPTDKPLTWEGRIFRADHVPRWVRTGIYPNLQADGGLSWDGMTIDVTEARAAEERLQLANAGLAMAAAAEERERLLQDMHDGFGSQLSSARLAIERGRISHDEVAKILQECSLDLHLMVDTLTNREGSLADAIADFRFRTDRRLVGVGPKLHWQIDIAQGTVLPTRMILQTLRVLQEALNNALRHAQAQNVTIGVCLAEDGPLTAFVVDDGIGMGPNGSAGRGIANMRKRCREIGAEFGITALHPGTRVSLRANHIAEAAA